MHAILCMIWFKRNGMISEDQWRTTKDQAEGALYLTLLCFVATVFQSVLCCLIMIDWRGNQK